MASRHLALGEAGEEIAARFLERRGLRIVDRRVRFRNGELDLVARNGREWVFIEVKTRASDRMGCAAEAMTQRKTQRMLRAVNEYLNKHELGEVPVRLDLLTIDIDTVGKACIEHFPGGIEPY